MGRPKGLPKSGGRKKGTPNSKITLTLREQAMASLDHRGGIEYLNRLEDAEFVKILCRVQPQDVKLDGQLGVDLVIRRSFVRKKAE